MRRSAGPYQVHKGPVAAGLQRGSRNDERVLALLQHQPHVDELVGEQRIVGVVEDGLGLDGSGGGIDLVVERQERTGGEVLRLGAVIRVNSQLFTVAGQRLHRGNLILGQCEDDCDGL